MNRHATPLAAKVAARNEAGQVANRIHRELYLILQPWLDKKIFNADGSKFHKFQNALPIYPGHFPEIIIRQSYGTLKATIRTCHQNPNNRGDCDHAQYAEELVYLGTIVNAGVLATLYDPPQPGKGAREDWTEAEVIQARKDLIDARAALGKAQNAIGSFGEYDQ